MLLHEKIQEITQIHQNITDTINNLEQHIQATYETAFNKALSDLKEQLNTQYNTQAKAILQENVDNLKAQNTQDLKALLHTIKAQNNTILESAKATLKAELESLAQSFLQQWGLDNLLHLQESLLDSLKQALTPQLQQDIQTALLSLTQDFFKNLNISDSINYENILLDYTALSQVLQSSQKLNTTLENLTEIKTQEFLNHNAKSLITQALKEQAPSIFREALKLDEIIKMRYETALRLASVQILGINELIQGIHSALSKDYYKPKLPNPNSIKNNVLVAK